MTRMACSIYDYFIPNIHEKIQNLVARIINEW